jgi:hypothetical protein
MQRYGHKLNIHAVGKQLVATCQCTKWRRALPVSDNRALMILVGVLAAKHDRHLDRLGHPSAENYVSNDSLPVLPDFDRSPQG